MARRRFVDFDDFGAWLEDASSARLSRRTSFTNGRNWAALYDALAMPLACAQRDEPDGDSVTVPRWVAEAVLLDVLQREIKGRKRWRDRYRQDLIDWYRFLIVWSRKFGHPAEARLGRTKARQRRVEFHRDAACWPTGAPETPYPWTTAEIDDWDVFEAASKSLSGTVYAGQPRTMKRSWVNVSAALKRGEAWRYYPSRWVTFKGLKFDVDRERTK